MRCIKISFEATAVLPYRFTPRSPRHCLRITKCNVQQHCRARGEEELLLLRNLEAYYGKSCIIIAVIDEIMIFSNVLDKIVKLCKENTVFIYVFHYAEKNWN